MFEHTEAKLHGAFHSCKIMSSYETLPASSVYFRAPTEDDLDAVYALEAASYPADEAATREKLLFRIQQAPSLFLVMLQTSEGADDAIIGFTCGTLTAASELTHSSMSLHEPQGRLLCVHSVVVDHPLRRQGLATKMLQAYLRLVTSMHPDLAEVRLICKEPLVPLYAGVGFKLLGPSPVEHGADQWLEMAYVVEIDS